MNLSKNNNDLIIGIIGLGYVGLPLAIEFGKKFKTIGFDIKKERIKNLSLSIDTTSEVNEVNFKKAHSKEKNRLLKVIENLQVENTDKQNLINKYQLSQEYLIDLISEQTRDIDQHIDNTRKMGRALYAYKKNTN